ncbi:Pentatricopeptide repeat-containing protein [Striga hermonthica]|uniref:Pentatricopeptide repeat-containing protein n=1 Tax=Striga hermonthica TaxID=68872 RepID=A0A9N7RK73_STRHE|nr:Pentatricopeptide repeat-containing protein [Striga hermonthica]
MKSFKYSRCSSVKPITLHYRTLSHFSKSPSAQFLAVQPHGPIPDDPKAIAAQVSASTNLKQLRQIFCRIIRTHLLHLHPHPFHYNTIARVYSRLESPREALRVHSAMRRAGLRPDSFTLPIVLKSAGQLSDRPLAEQVHGTSFKLGLDKDMYCESGLISAYSKGGRFESARKVFEDSTEKKLGSWNAIIAGLSQGARTRDAVHMFLTMVRNGFFPDDVTMVSVTSACGNLGDLGLAFQLHKCVFQARNPEKPDTLMNNSVIDMYGKCGRMDLAYNVFVRMEEKNVSSWTSMIVGYAAQGHVGEALGWFESMRQAGVGPNHVTFVGVLTACVHGGLVREGKYYYRMMREEYGMEPRLAHYGCMVDLLGRAGLLGEARRMVEGMPMRANAPVLGCLMGACEKHGDVETGQWVAKQLVELEPENEGAFVVLANIYADQGQWEQVERLRGIIKERKLAKLPACSFI